MAELDLDYVITRLKNMPRIVGEKAVEIMKEEVPSENGGVHVGDNNYSTGRLRDSIRAIYPSDETILIVTDAPYANIVLSGRKEVFPKHRTKSGGQGWLHWDNMGYGKHGDVFARHSKAVPPNRFDERTVDRINAWVDDLFTFI